MRGLLLRERGLLLQERHCPAVAVHPLLPRRRRVPLVRSADLFSENKSHVMVFFKVSDDGTKPLAGKYVV